MTFPNLILAELRKTATLPSAWAGVAVAVAGSVAITLLDAMVVRQAVTSGDTGMIGDSSPFEAGFAAVPILGVVGAVVVGVVVMGSEYTADRAEAGGGRQITTTLAAAPHRGTLLLAKAFVVLVAVVATAVVTIPTCQAVAHAVLGTAGTEIVTPGDAVTRSFGAALYWALMGWIALAVTALTRSGVVPLVVLVANSSLVSISLLLTKVTPLAFWLPDVAGRRLFGIETVEGGLDTLPGALVMGAWALVLLVAAVITFTRRDA